MSSLLLALISYTLQARRVSWPWLLWSIPLFSRQLPLPAWCSVPLPGSQTSNPNTRLSIKSGLQSVLPATFSPGVCASHPLIQMKRSERRDWEEAGCTWHLDLFLSCHSYVVWRVFAWFVGVYSLEVKVYLSLLHSNDVSLFLLDQSVPQQGSSHPLL